MKLLNAVTTAFKLDLVSLLVYVLGNMRVLATGLLQGVEKLLQVYRVCAVIAVVALAAVAWFGLGISAGVAVVASIVVVAIQWLTCTAMFKPMR